MSNENLLETRYKLIAAYPNSPFEIGDIFVVNGDEEYINPPIGIQPFKYPYLFKKLEWWEDRKIEDMPKYTKMNCYIKPCTDNPENFELKKGQIFKPEKWGLNAFEMGHWVFSVKLVEPSNKEEYLSNLQKLDTLNK